MPYLHDGAAFFLPEHDEGAYPTGPAICLPSVRSIRDCVGTKCPLCTVFTTSVNLSFAPHLAEIAPIRLVRAMTDPHQSVQLVVDLDDVSRTFFYRVPQRWRKSSVIVFEQGQSIT